LAGLFERFGTAAKGVSIALTGLITFLGLAKAAMIAKATATGIATMAVHSFRSAVGKATLGVTILVGAIGYAIAKMIESKVATEDAGEELDEVAKIAEQVKEAFGDLGDSDPASIFTDIEDEASRANDTLQETINLIREGIAEVEAFKKAQAEQMESMIRAEELKALKARASGDAEAAKAIEDRVKIAREAVRLQDRHNMTMDEAIALAQKLKEAGEMESERTPSATAGRTGGSGAVLRTAEAGRRAEPRFDLGGADVTTERGLRDAVKTAAQQASKEMGKELRFERTAGAGGAKGFTRFVDGMKGEFFTDEQIRAALAGEVPMGMTAEEAESLAEAAGGAAASAASPDKGADGKPASISDVVNKLDEIKQIVDGYFVNQ